MVMLSNAFLLGVVLQKVQVLFVSLSLGLRGIWGGLAEQEGLQRRGAHLGTYMKISNSARGVRR